jgi:hypothetical protein
MKRFPLSKLTFLLIMLLSFMLMTAQAASALSLNGYTWKIVKSPNGSFHNNFLNGVAPISKDDAWAVGANYTGPEGPPVQGLIEHWNGKSWRVVSSPNVGSPNTVLNNIITEVVAISASDIWTSGDYVLGNGNSQTLLEHWNGSKWSVVPTPNIESHDDYFQGMAADSANDLWAVGGDNDPVHHQQLTLIEHCC